LFNAAQAKWPNIDEASGAGGYTPEGASFTRKRRERPTPAPDAHEREQRILDNLHLVGPIAGKLARTNRHIDIDDLTSVGNEALIEAVDAFDPKKGEQFEHYARTAIRNRMLTYVGKESRQPKQMTEDTPEPVARAEASTLEEGEVHDILMDAVSRRSPEERRLILKDLRSGKKGTLTELAREAGVTPQAMKGRQVRIMLALRRDIESKLGEQPQAKTYSADELAQASG
jgi:RNA polymerase sigma factor (sigma-70 family)